MTSKRSAKELRLLALELYFKETHNELELVMSEMAERFPRTHRVLVRELADAINESVMLDSLEGIEDELKQLY